MQLQVPFALPVAVFDFSEHLPYLRSLYQTETLNHTGTTACDTTLRDYELSSTQTEVIDRPEAEALRKSIGAAATEFATALGYAAEQYDPTVRRFWLNAMTSGMMHHPHSHNNNHFSGCIYIDVPPGSGTISFNSFKERFDYTAMRVAQYTVYNADAWNFNPTEGQFYLWESWVRHGVPPGQYQGVRRTAALDVVMNLKK